MIKSLAPFAALSALLLAGRPVLAAADAPDNSLESLLVRAPLVVIGHVTAVHPADDAADIKIDSVVKGQAVNAMTVKRVVMGVSPKSKKPRLAAGDSVVLFLDTPKNSAPVILHSQALATEADRKAMAASVTEILPFAPPLANLHDPQKPVDEIAIHKALTKLIVSKNPLTQIFLGDLMATTLHGRVPPNDTILFMALLSPRVELKKGALIWARGYKVLPPRILLLVQDIAGDPEQKVLAPIAQETLKKAAL